MANDESAAEPSPAKTPDARAVEFLPVLYRELKELAAARLRHERPDHTLQPTALVHEVYLKLQKERHAACSDRVHFFALAARTIHRVLIDHERRRAAAKRASPTRVEWTAELNVPVATSFDLLELEEALQKLAELSERQAKVVEMRFFADMTVEDIAEALGVSNTTVKNDWQVARAWLARALGGSGK